MLFSMDISSEKKITFWMGKHLLWGVNWNFSFSRFLLIIPWYFAKFQNCLIFPWLEKLSSFSQVFQVLWEPCHHLFQVWVSVWCWCFPSAVSQMCWNESYLGCRLWSLFSCFLWIIVGMTVNCLLLDLLLHQLYDLWYLSGQVWYYSLLSLGVSLRSSV